MDWGAEPGCRLYPACPSLGRLLGFGGLQTLRPKAQAARGLYFAGVPPPSLPHLFFEVQHPWKLMRYISGFAGSNSCPT